MPGWLVMALPNRAAQRVTAWALACSLANCKLTAWAR
jgi:hypothetical protein